MNASSDESNAIGVNAVDMSSSSAEAQNAGTIVERVRQRQVGTEGTKTGTEKDDKAAKKQGETTAAQAKDITARMKLHDGGSQKATMGADGRVDAFTRFSNENVRMMHLLGLDEDPEVDHQGNTEWRRMTGYQGRRRLRRGVNANVATRKTRLSTELHPDAMI